MNKIAIVLSFLFFVVTANIMADDSEILFVQNEGIVQPSHVQPIPVTVSEKHNVDSNSSDTTEIDYAVVQKENATQVQPEPVELPTVTVTAKSNCHRESMYPGLTIDQPLHGPAIDQNSDMQGMGVFTHDAKGNQVVVISANYTEDHKQLWYQVVCHKDQ